MRDTCGLLIAGQGAARGDRRATGELRGIRFLGGNETCNEVGAVIANVGGDARVRARRVAAAAGLGWVSIFASLARRRGRSNPIYRRHGGCESWC